MARKWFPSLSDILKTLAHQLEKWLSFFRYQLKRLLRLNKPPRIQPYRGFGDGTNWYLMGRVLENLPPPPAMPSDPWWQNAMAVLRRFMTDEVPDAHVAAVLGDQQVEAISDEEGYFRFRVDGVSDHETRLHADWQQVDLRLQKAGGGETGTRATGFIRVPGERVEYGIISDVDDTVIESHATSFISLARTTLMKNVHTRTPLAGVDRFYRAMERGLSGMANNPFFYVSSSAWNLYDFIEEFLQVHNIPIGPLLLRDLGIDDKKFIKSGHEHKFEKIDRVMSFFPNLPFVLVGDAGQDDPVIYREVVRRNENRIRAIYIRTVRQSSRNDRARRVVEEMAAEGIPMLLVADSDQAIRHATTEGLIAPGEIDLSADGESG